MTLTTALRNTLAVLALSTTTNVVSAPVATPALVDGPRYSFGVLPVRSPAVSAQYWNPILAYVSAKTGVALELKLARTGTESSAATLRGDYDFVWGNHQFKPRAIEEGYRTLVVARGEPIASEIIVRSDSAALTLKDLNGGTVGFPSKAAFVGYLVPMDHLVRNNFKVTPVFGGNQEGIMAQLKSGGVPAAAVNSKVLRAYAEREGLSYRVLWRSQEYLDFPVSAHPRVPDKTVKALQQAFVGMSSDPKGAAILAASAEIVKQHPPFGFRAISQAELHAYIDFFKTTVLQDVD
jgi:phosphonate transport system substrate-binding protein